MARFTWRKGASCYRGVRLPESYSLHCGSDTKLATATRLAGGDWYWYGDGKSTAHNPRPLDVVKAEAEQHFRAKFA